MARPVRLLRPAPATSVIRMCWLNRNTQYLATSHPRPGASAPAALVAPRCNNPLLLTTLDSLAAPAPHRRCDAIPACRAGQPAKRRATERGHASARVAESWLTRGKVKTTPRSSLADGNLGPVRPQRRRPRERAADTETARSLLTDDAVASAPQRNGRKIHGCASRVDRMAVTAGHHRTVRSGQSAPADSHRRLAAPRLSSGRF